MRLSSRAKFSYRILAGLLLLAGAAFSQTISIVSGDGQLVSTFTNPQSTPMVVVVHDAAGNPIPNATVTWAVISGTSTGGLLNFKTTTDSNGQTSNDFVPPILPLGASLLQSTVSATYGSSTVNFTIMSVSFQNGVFGAQIVAVSPTASQQPSACNTSTVSAPCLLGPAGSQSLVPIKIQVTAVGGFQSGAGIPNLLMTVSAPSGGPSIACAGGNPKTDATGTATCNVVFGGKVGTAFVTATIGYAATYTFNFKVTVGPPSIIAPITGDRQSGNAGQALPVPLVAQVTDAGGNPLSGISLVFAPAVQGTVFLSNVNATSDNRGLVSANATLGSVAGPVEVTVSTSDGKIVGTFHLTVNVQVGGLQTSGDQQSAIVGNQFTNPLMVTVVDTNGNPIQGAQVTFVVASGSATLGTTSATTNASGQVSTTVTAGNTPGPVSVTANVSGTSSTATFNLTVRPLGPSCIPGSTFVNGASFKPHISPGAVATIYCSGIADNIQGTVMPSLFGPLPYQVAGVQVTFGSNNIPAPIFDVSNVNGMESVTVEVPLETPVDPGVPVTITANGQPNTTPVTANIEQVAPGIFEAGDVGPDGLRTAVVLRPDGSVASATNPILRGENGRAFVTGLIPPAGLATDMLSPLDSDIVITTPVIVGINNAGVTTISVKYARNLVGIWEVEFLVPSNTAQNLRAPFAILIRTSSGPVFSQSSTIPVQ